MALAIIAIITDLAQLSHEVFPDVSIVDEGCTKGLDIPKIMDNWVSKVRGHTCWVMIQITIILHKDGVPCTHCHRDSNWHQGVPGPLPQRRPGETRR